MKDVTLLWAGVCFGKAMHKSCVAFLLMAGLLLASYPSQAQEPPCSAPEGYTLAGTYNGHTYYLSNFTAFGPDAVTAAASTGGHLATIADAGENAFVSAAAGGLRWIGFTDVAVEGTFEWVTGEPVTYTNWCPNEPNNCCSGENWTAINWCGAGGWNDLYDGVTQGDNGWSIPFVVEFDGVEGDDDCDGVLNCSDVCPGGNDNGPCNATSLPAVLPAGWLCNNNNNSEKIKVCHDGNTICISVNAVPTHLAHGDFLGPCSSCEESFSAPIANESIESVEKLSSEFAVYPNPSNGDFKITLDKTGSGIINIIDQNGNITQSFNIGEQKQLDINLIDPGVYLIQLITDRQIITKKITVVR